MFLYETKHPTTAIIDLSVVISITTLKQIFDVHRRNATNKDSVGPIWYRFFLQNTLNGIISVPVQYAVGASTLSHW